MLKIKAGDSVVVRNFALNTKAAQDCTADKEYLVVGLCQSHGLIGVVILDDVGDQATFVKNEVLLVRRA